MIEVVEAAQLISGLVSSYLPQISVALTLAALRELYRTNKQIHANEQMAQKNRNRLDTLTHLVAEEHDYEALKQS